MRLETIEKVRLNRIMGELQFEAEARKSIQDDVDVMDFSPHSIAASIISIELNSSVKIYTHSEISKLTNVPEKEISESKPIVRLSWEQSPNYIPPEFGPQD